MENDTVLDHGITLEKHLLYLASPESHTKLRNANLPRGVGIHIVRELESKGLLQFRMIPMDSNGSIVEYTLTLQGQVRLNELHKGQQR